MRSTTWRRRATSRCPFETPEYTANSDALGTLRLLEAIRILGLEKRTRFYQAATSEMYGRVQESPQRESTPFYPRSPYGAAKVYAYWITINYREAYGLYACNGILFNHESPVRGETFVTVDYPRTGAHLQGCRNALPGNLGQLRDWGHARLRPRAVADVAAGTGRRFRHCHGRAAFGAGIRHAGRRTARPAPEWRGKASMNRGSMRRRARSSSRSTRAPGPTRSKHCWGCGSARPAGRGTADQPSELVGKWSRAT